MGWGVQPLLLLLLLLLLPVTMERACFGMRRVAARRCAVASDGVGSEGMGAGGWVTGLGLGFRLAVYGLGWALGGVALVPATDMRVRGLGLRVKGSSGSRLK